MKNKFEEPEALNRVGDFHHLFNMPVLEDPQIPPMERCNLRISLLAEELRELEEGIEKKNIIEIADALCDLQYVLSGAILEFGLGSKFKALFDEVQRSNMSKACATLEEAIATQEKYAHEKQVESEIIIKDGKFLVYRKEDGKVLKSVHYSPANLEKLL
ncbi:MAG: nucleoside triphosphate pyrophosphohydrolase family protein [Saprospiraceae bacterium]|nr:nucleoside triphosphate pyrophosphohydrolase family protein [Saprospiraceae bacterium]